MHSPRPRIVPALVLFLLSLFATSALAAPPPRVIPGQVIVKWKKTASRAAKAAARANVHGKLKRDFRFIGVEVQNLTGMTTEQAIASLKKNPNVEYAEPNYEIHIDVVPNDPRFPELYGMRNTGQTGGTAGADIKATQAWDLFTGDPNLKVGVIDTGVDYNHPDLAANVWTNPGEIPDNNIDDDGNGYIDDVHGYDFANNDGDPFDDNGHGTHCSGTIAGVGNNNVGVAGVNWNAKIVAIKFLNAGGSGSTEGAIAGVQYAIAVGVRLTSNSWGGGGFSQALLDAINAAGAAGQLFVAAAGNSSVNTDVTPQYPAAYNSPYIISVAATDHNDNLASFSNYGATTVDIGAPGVNILSCQPGGGYQMLSGTSMATPHVSGVVALTMGRFPLISNLQAKTLILNAADPKASLAGKCVTGGRLNAFMSIAEPDDTPPGMISDLSTQNPGSNTMGLRWTATGDDGSTGRATHYEIRYSTSPITEANWSSATLLLGPDPKTAGSAESFEASGLAFSTSYYFAIKAFDEFSNAGPISNNASGMTLGAPDITAFPTSFTSELLTGATETQTLTLRNDGLGTLDFTIPTPNLFFLTPANPYQPYAKGEADTRVGPPVTDSKGGPDAFGYRWADSDEPGGPVFSWVDITSVGTPVAITGDDATSAPINMGMGFPFYGSTFTSVRVSTNGFLTFTDASGLRFFDNQLLPNSGGPANLVAPMWDDMDFGVAQRAYTYYDGSRYIVSWVNVPHWTDSGPPDGPYTFQAILYPTGEIRYQYTNLGTGTNSATVGIQNGTKSVGLNVAFNTNYLKNNLAVRIVPVPQWLTVSPSSGRIPAGQGQAVQVRFNALGLAGGTFDGTIHVTSNDPDESDVSLPAHLHVTGAPDIAVNPASLDFGSIFVGASPTQTLNVTNPGTDNLVVTGITSNDPYVTATPSSFTLVPLAGQVVTVTYHPTAPATTNATLSIASNDPDTPTKTISVTGVATPAPSFNVNPTSFDVALLTNTAASRTLTISNTGGSNYVFTAEALAFGTSGSVTVSTDATNVYTDKGQPDVVFGPVPLRAGGPDVFGYTYLDSDEPGGPAFSWVDIRPVGTNLTISGDDATSAAIPIGFAFPYYGNTFTTLRVCTNGWISFTNSSTAFTNQPLPNSGSGVPENLLSVFWDDLNFPSRRAWTHYDGSRFIIQYQDVPRLGDSGNLNTFEIILYPTGQIVYQYLAMNAAVKNSCTLGMQNQARNDGLQVVFNADYVKNNLAIRFRPPSRFLTVTPTSGTVAPGGSTNLTVGFNAADLFGGVYNGAVRIRGNDPILPQRDADCRLTVTGVADILVTPSSIAYGNVFVGFPSIRQLTVRNVGTDVLNVSNITTSDPVYGVDQASFSIPPLGQAVVTVSFNPPTPTSFPATLTIQSNDPDTPMLSVGVTGAGLMPPDIGVTPTSFAATLPIPSSQTSTLHIANTGGSDLTFVLGSVLTAESVPVYEPLALGKGEADPRQGILGSGGPDIFGYTWRDSDDPDGPAFDWVDITTIGTLLPLSGDDTTLPGIPIGFDFPFYGNTFNSVNVCTNGWLSFTSTLTAYDNQPLPNSGSTVPENLLAPFWDDMNPLAIQRVYSYRDGTRFIVSYQLMQHYPGTPGSGGPYTFQVILYPTGRIVYQYLDMQSDLINSATIGIQNAAKNDGLTVAFNNNYVHNNLAIELRTTPDWLTATPTSGTVPAGGTFDVQVTMNSNELFGGVYNGELRITNNDPDEGVVHVPATLTAVGTPDIAASPASLDFGTLYLSQHRDLTVLIKNDGNDVLNIASASLTHPGYQLVGASFPISLGNRGSTTLTVRFAPATACAPPNACAGDLVLNSNDPDEAAFHVALTGFALVPPEAGITPASLHAALATNLGPTAITRIKTLRLSNTGGSDLVWTAEALSALPAALNLTPSSETGKGQSGTPGVAALGAGGPDAFGYRYADSDDPVQGTPFSWIDITSIGTAIPLNGDDQNLGPFPLPFSFSFYGNTFSSFRVCSNGWVSFTSPQVAFTNTGLPNAVGTTPENLLAPFWDDLDFSSAGHAYSHYDGSKFIIEYAGVPHFAGGGTYTFEIILYPSGTVDFQYLDVSGRLNEQTIGIQNASRDIGLQVAFNTTYVKNNLRVRFSRASGWLTVAPQGGTIAAGAYSDLNVTFDATGLPDGDRSGVVRVHSNDLTDPTLTAGCDLHVGSISAELDVNPNNLNRSSNGNWVMGTVEPGVNDPHNIRTSSVLLQRSIPVGANTDISYPDKDGDGNLEAKYKFSRQALLNQLPSGASVPVEMIGEVEDVTWFSGTAMVRALKPTVTEITGTSGINNQTGQPVYYAGSAHQFSWDAPDGFSPNYYDFWFSADGGQSWSLVTGNLTTRTAVWQVPATATQSGLLELASMDNQGLMGSWLSPSFDIITNPTGVADNETILPKEYALRMRGANPLIQGATRFELALPKPTAVSVRVYDVNGRLIRDLVGRTLTAGYHPLGWDGRNSAGLQVSSGVYFVRAEAAGKRMDLRLAVVR